MDALADFQIAFITAADGAQIGYRQTGTGPGAILVHGGLQSSFNFTALARALSADYTVYVPDRRGRGLSAANEGNTDLAAEAEDLLALVRATGSENIFGLSSGAIITLKAALSEPALKKVALYEPPIPAAGDPFAKFDRTYEAAVRKGNFGKAFMAILKATGDPSFMRLLPGFLMAPLINRLMKAQLKNPKANELPLQELVPTFRNDRFFVKASEPLIEQAKALTSEVLLLNGQKSRDFLRKATARLARQLPDARRMTFEKQGHLAADNTGDPLKVAQELKQFFGK